MSESIWDDADLKSNDDYIKFDQVGDTVTGKIISIRKHTFDDGKVVPQLLLDVAGEEKTLTAGQIQLKAKLSELRPGVGDVLTVTMSNVEKRAGGKTLKHFDVTLGGAAPAAAAPAAPPVDAQAAAAAIANLTPEQKVALGISA
jgi:hypothetical protein